MRYPLACPDITESEIDAVVSVLKTPHLSLGPKLPEFEQKFAAYCGARHAIAVSSGTTGLHLIVRSIGIGPGDEVITTPFSFVASANAVLYEQGRPVFVDIDRNTWNIDESRIASAITTRTKAVLAVDVFGMPADYDRIRGVAEPRGLRVIEDSCEALGSRCRGRMAGMLAEAGVFGFYPNKQLTTGEGGMIVTDDDHLARLCKSMRNQGRDTDGGWLAHPRMGYNYRLSDINCALGIAQLDRIEQLLAVRRRTAGWYREELGDDRRVRFQAIRDGVDMSWFVLVVCLTDEYTVDDRDRILTGLRDRGIGCSNYFAAIHLQPYMMELFGLKRGDFPVCESVADRTVALPFQKNLARGDVATICHEFRQLL